MTAVWLSPKINELLLLADLKIFHILMVIPKLKHSELPGAMCKGGELSIKSLLSGKKSETIAAILVVTVLILILSGWLVSKVPGLEIALVIIISLVWLAAIIGKFATCESKLLSQFGEKVFNHVQDMIIGSVMILVISFIAMTFHTYEKVQSELEARERKIQAKLEKEERLKNEMMATKFEKEKSAYLRLIDKIRKDASTATEKDIENENGNEAWNQFAALEKKLLQYKSTKVATNTAFITLQKEQISLKELLLRNDLEKTAQFIIKHPYNNTPRIQKYPDDLIAYEQFLADNHSLPTLTEESKQLIYKARNFKRVLAAVDDLDKFKNMANEVIKKRRKLNASDLGALADIYTNALKQISILEEYDSQFGALIFRKVNLSQERKQLERKIAQANRKKQKLEIAENKNQMTEIYIPRSSPGDRGRYYLLKKTRKGSVVRALHKRVGTNSIGYTLTETNCRTMKMREIGYSEVSPTAIKEKPTKWFELTPGSSKSDFAHFVCNK